MQRTRIADSFSWAILFRVNKHAYLCLSSNAGRQADFNWLRLLCVNRMDWFAWVSRATNLNCRIWSTIGCRSRISLRYVEYNVVLWSSWLLILNFPVAVNLPRSSLSLFSDFQVKSETQVRIMLRFFAPSSWSQKYWPSFIEIQTLKSEFTSVLPQDTCLNFFIVLYDDAYSPGTVPFTSWQTTGENDWIKTRCDLRQVSPIASTRTASLGARRPCSNTGNIEAPWKLVPAHRPREISVSSRVLSSMALASSTGTSVS